MVVRCFEPVAEVVRREAVVDESGIKRGIKYAIMELLTGFLDSGAEIALVEDWKDEYSSIESVRNTLTNTIIRLKMDDQIQCFLAKGSIYLRRL